MVQDQRRRPAEGAMREIVPGNNMKPYSGVASADDRAKVTSFLRSLSTGE
jgi:cytochrome c2